MTEGDHVLIAQAAFDDGAAVCARLVGTELTPAFEGPLDRAFLTAYVEFVEATAGVVADVGCGPGRVAAFLATHGLDAVGVDVSPAMLTVAREAHPDIRFDEGRLTALPFAEASLSGAVCWYNAPLLRLRVPIPSCPGSVTPGPRR